MFGIFDSSADSMSFNPTCLSRSAQTFHVMLTCNSRIGLNLDLTESYVAWTLPSDLSMVALDQWRGKNVATHLSVSLHARGHLSTPQASAWAREMVLMAVLPVIFQRGMAWHLLYVATSREANRPQGIRKPISAIVHALPA